MVVTTSTVIVFAPVVNVTEPVAPPVSVSIVVTPFLIVTVAVSSTDSAVTVCGLVAVVVVYQICDPLKAGVSVSAPIVSVERSATKGLV